MWETLKEYIPIALHWDKEGVQSYNQEIIPFLTPTCLFLEAGGVYGVDQIREDGMLPSFISGGYGIRYTARTSCDHEENYNKVYYLYYEGFGQLGRWRYGDDYVAVDVTWDDKGHILPSSIYLDEFQYVIPKDGILRMSPMSKRKTDGTGQRYIVKASCPQLHDYNREFALMLEHGGKLIGKWFCEDADRVHGRKVAFSELDDGAFHKSLVEESMGVSNGVCARYQITIDMADFLRSWNLREHNGVWLPPEVFEKKIKEGIIYPKFYAPVMVAGRGGVESDVMQWGIKRHWASDTLHNLRCDKLATRDTFDSIKGNRCVVPCAGFYEYEKEGKMVIGDYLFANEDHSTLYLAGLFDAEGGDRHYTIVTTNANSSVDIHDRMPIVLRKAECRAWLSGRLDFKDVQDRQYYRLLKKAV